MKRVTIGAVAIGLALSGCGGEGEGGEVVAEGPAEVLLDGAQRPP